MRDVTWEQRLAARQADYDMLLARKAAGEKISDYAIQVAARALTALRREMEEHRQAQADVDAAANDRDWSLFDATASLTSWLQATLTTPQRDGSEMDPWSSTFARVALARAAGANSSEDFSGDPEFLKEVVRRTLAHTSVRSISDPELALRVRTVLAYVEKGQVAPSTPQPGSAQVFAQQRRTEDDIPGRRPNHISLSGHPDDPVTSLDKIIPTEVLLADAAAAWILRSIGAPSGDESWDEFFRFPSDSQEFKQYLLDLADPHKSPVLRYVEYAERSAARMGGYLRKHPLLVGNKEAMAIVHRLFPQRARP